ncbi:GAF domain-containing sensor histidine kinase [Nostoc favosum]|uniref:GAF domain-containing sensor histidine kinase n=1 Tax=Nostoc favosum TaxID=2907819 RepID=UPI003F68B468
MITRIRESLDLDTIFQTTVTEARQMLQADRVTIFRFDLQKDWEGEFISEDVVPECNSVIAEKVYDYCFGENFAPLYAQGRVNAIADIYQGKFPGCYIQILEKFQVRANMIAPLLKKGELWGLLCIHQCTAPRHWQPSEIEFTSQIAEQLGVALKQDSYLKQVQEQIDKTDLDFLIEDLPKTLESMKVGTERICEIVLSLRNFSRTDEAELKPVDIREGLDSTLLILGHRLKNNNERPAIEIVKEYVTLPLLECYPAQLNQVFMNLLSNSIDALEEKFKTIQQRYLKLSQRCPKIPLTIWISTQAVNNLIVIRIADNGLGIPEEVRSHIFDPFFTTKAPGKGTGLGLSISYQIIVEKHHGQIKCSSKPGEGTEFLIEIPSGN